MSDAGDKLAKSVLAGERRALAKAITLLEGQRPEQREAAGKLLAALLPHSGQSVRLAISGAPGVGKSTFIEAFGRLLLARGARLAVLAVDPSSPLSGGSILGDRVRMEELSRDERVFIRPSPAGTTLGGTARATREAIVACEAAGYDFVIVETVGVGQSESLAASMVDAFLILHLPNSGDELQGIKRGILELADLVAVTKADGATVQPARLAQVQLKQALMLARPNGAWLPPVQLVSSVEGTGLTELLTSLDSFFAGQKASAAFAAKRRSQAAAWFRAELLEQLQDLVRERGDLADLADQLEESVQEGRLPARVAAAQLINRIARPRSGRA